METHSLICPDCKAPLEVEAGLDTFYCRYCGAKVIVDGMSGNAYKARVEARRMEHEESKEDKRLAQERFKLEMEAKEKDKERKHDLLFWLVNPYSIILILLLGFFIAAGCYIGFEAAEHEALTKELQAIEAEVGEAIAAGDYDTALFKANQLHSDNYSSADRDTWDEKREAYIAMIEEKTREYEIAKPDTIFAPANAETFKDMKYTEVVEALEKAGFTNITTKEAVEKAGFLSSGDRVDHVLIGGKANFTEEDYFPKDTPVIVYYRAK